MNKTECEYAAYLEVNRALDGEIERWAFEPLKLRLAKATFYTPDFMVVLKSGLIELHEVKGHWEDDARVKIKVAAAAFPEFRFLAVKKLPKRDGGGWSVEDF